MIPRECWDEPGALPEGFWIKAVFLWSSWQPPPPAAPSSPEASTSQELHLERAWKNKAVPLSKGKAEQRDYPWYQRFPPGIPNAPGNSSPRRWGHSSPARSHRGLQIQEPPAVLAPSLFKTGNEAQEVFCGTQFKQDHLCWLEVKLFIPGFFWDYGSGHGSSWLHGRNLMFSARTVHGDWD